MVYGIKICSYARDYNPIFMDAKNRFSVATNGDQLPVAYLEWGGTLGATEILVFNNMSTLKQYATFSFFHFEQLLSSILSVSLSSYSILIQL